MDQQDFWDDYQHIKRDINRLRGSEQRLKGIRARYTAVGELTEELLMVIDREGMILEINRAGQELLSVGSDVVGKHVDAAFSDARTRSIGQVAARSLEGKQTARADWVVGRATGPSLTLSARVAPVMDDTNRPIAAVVIARDITDLTTLDEDLANVADEVGRLRKRVQRALDTLRREPPTRELPDIPPKGV